MCVCGLCSNFSCYRRFVTMPAAGGDGEGQFYSYNVGPVHVVVTNTEYYYFVGYGWRQIQRQYEWLERDLAEANKPENRALRPWIICAPSCHCYLPLELLHKSST